MRHRIRSNMAFDGCLEMTGSGSIGKSEMASDTVMGRLDLADSTARSSFDGLSACILNNVSPLATRSPVL